MDIFPKDKIKEGEVRTEVDYQKAANKALLFSILGWILSGGLVGILLEAYVFKYVDRANHSSDSEVRDRASLAKRIALVYWFLVSLGALFIPYLIFIDTNITLSILSGIATIGVIVLVLWLKKKNSWPKKKLMFVMGMLVLYAVLASFYASYIQ